MKKLISVPLLIFFIYLMYGLFFTHQKPKNTEISQKRNIIFDKWEYALINNISLTGLTLKPNFKNGLPSEELMNKYDCKYGVNGGFYTEDNKPLGFLRLSDEIISPVKNSRLFNGFIQLTQNNLTISDAVSSASGTMLQTGPMLIQNNIVESLIIKNDKFARRMVMGKDRLDKPVFLAVFDPDADLSGPYLADLPKIIKEISERENLGITAAVNLDGGRASAFYGSGKILKEFDPVGSWWCVK